MCGHVGVITGRQNGFFSNEIKNFSTLLYLDVLRGEDGTGIALVQNTQEVNILKDSIDSCVFLKNTDYLSIKNKALSNGQALLGHNRKTTMGGNAKENTHPFVVNNDKVFFHNGTLHNHKKLYDTTVDSEALGLHLTGCKTKEEFEKALDKVSGAYACVWYDQDQHKVFFLRNKQRPLSWAKTKMGTIYYASESQMLEFVLSREGSALESTGDFKDDVLYSLDLTKYNLDFVEEKLDFFIQATTPIIGTTKKSSNVTAFSNIKASSGKISKNEFKRLNGTVFKDVKYVAFFADQVEEDNLGNVKIYGTSEEYPGVLFKGTFISTLHLKGTNITNNDLKDRRFHGQAGFLEYNKEAQMAVMSVSNLNTNVKYIERFLGVVQ